MADRSVRVTLRANVADFKAQLAQASKSLEEVAKSGDKTGKVAETALGRMAQSAQLQRQHWDTVSAGLLGYSAVAGVAVGAIVKTYADFDQAMSAVSAATHESAANMQLLRDAAIQAGADTAYSATEAASAIEALAKAGISTRDILNGGLKGALDLAAAGSLDVGQAAEIAATAMTQFKLSGDQTRHVADLLAAGAGKAQGDVTDLGMALKQSGLVASQTGLSIEETTAALSAFASAGLIGSDAGTSFKAMLQRLTPQSAAAKRTMDELGISAYDAQGNFIGLERFAGVLQNAMKGLSAEQRNAAMQTIFGSDSVRAASVLYEQGAEGVAEWTKKVNDSGYAAETAAKQLDNLKGDWERLTGSMESLFLKSGGGANDFLRGIVQGAEHAIDTFSRLPAPIQQGALAFVAFTGAASGLLGIGMKVFTLITDFKTAFDSLKSANIAGSAAGMTKFGAAMRGLSIAAGSAVALVAVAAAIDQVNKAATNYQGVQSIEKTTAALLSMKDADIDGLFSAMNVDVKSFGDALDKTLSTDLNSKINRFASDINQSLGGFLTDTFGDARNQIDQMGKALANLVNQGQADRAAQIFGELAVMADKQGYSVEQLKALMPDYQDALLNVANSQELQQGATEDATGAIQDQSSALGDLVESLSKAYGVVLSVRDAQRQFEESIDSASEALEKNGQTLDITTEAGRANQAALDDIAKSGWKLVEALQAQGATEEELQASMATTRDAFIRAAEAMGMEQAEAEALADKLGLIPSDVTTTVTAPGADTAKGQLDAVKLAADNIPTSKTVGVYVTGSEHAYNQLMSVRNAMASIGGSTHIAMGVGGVGGSTAYATGGAVIGPGSGTSDSIVARLSNGEHVLTASDVSKLGGQSGVYRLRDAIQSGRVPAFASGGAVGASAAVAYLPERGAVSVEMPRTMVVVDVNGELSAQFRIAAKNEAIRVVKEARL